MTEQKQVIPEGYKQTEVGVIPQKWAAVQLKEVFVLKNGYSFKGEFFSNTGPIVLTPGNFKLDGGLYFEERNTKRYSGDYPDGFEFKTGDLVIVMTDLTPDCNLLGKPAFVKETERVLHNQRIGKIEKLAKDWDLIYLYYTLLSPVYLSTIKNAATGSTVRHTSPKTIANAWVVLPPIQEQTAIAHALSDVDALISELEKLIAKKQAIKTATMQQLLTGKTRLPEFALREDGTPKGYKQSELGEIPEDWCIPLMVELTRNIIDYRGRTPKKLGMEWGGGNILALSAGNVKKGYIDFDTDSYLGSDDLYKRWMTSGEPEKDDIVFTMEAPLGNVALIPDSKKYILSQRTILLQIDRNKFDPILVFQVLCSDSFQSFISESATGSTAQGIKRSTFEKLRLALPQELTEQIAIASILSDMDEEIQTLQQRLTKTRQIKQGMMQELLTGKTRLVKPEVRA